METKTKPKKLPKLTKKQAGFVKDYVETGNGTQAALKNYDIESSKPEKVASVIAVENLAKPSVALAVEIGQETLKSALQKQGVTPEKIAQKIDVLLEAQKVTRSYVKGDLVTEVIEEDHNAIDKGLKHAKDIYGVEDLDTKPKSNNTYNFIFSAETQKEIKELEAKIKQRLINPNVQTPEKTVDAN